MADMDSLIQRILAIREARDWKQFHNHKDLAVSLVLEAGEVLEHFQWRNGTELEEYGRTHAYEIGEELADVLYWVLLLGHDLNIDVLKSLDVKLSKIEEKYPVDKAKGNHKKYTEMG